MGKPYYIGELKGSEEYYWIYGNGENTDHNVTNTGTGVVQLVEVDLASSSLGTEACFSR
jgi:hypothetical protein